MSKDQFNDQNDTIDERNCLPMYQCHKKVRAAFINDVHEHTMGEGATLTLRIGGEKPNEEVAVIDVNVSNEFMAKHKPNPGGYYVLYEDNYESYSPAAAFEGGYERIRPTPQTDHNPESAIPADDIEKIFTFQPPTDENVEKYKEIRAAAMAFARVVDKNCPPGPDRTTAFRRIREAVMTANASIALDGTSYR